MTYTLQLAIFSPPNSLFTFILTLWARHKLCARCSFGSCHIVNAGFTRLRIRGIVLEIIVYSFNLSKLHSLGRNASLFMGFVLACYWRFFWLKWNQRSLRSEILFCCSTTETLTCLILYPVILQVWCSPCADKCMNWTVFNPVWYWHYFSQFFAIFLALFSDSSLSILCSQVIIFAE